MPIYEFECEKCKGVQEILLRTDDAPPNKCEKCGAPMVIKIGRFGKFLACSNYPECKNTKELTKEGAIAEPEIERIWSIWCSRT